MASFSHALFKKIAVSNPECPVTHIEFKFLNQPLEASENNILFEASENNILSHIDLHIVPEEIEDHIHAIEKLTWIPAWAILLAFVNLLLEVYQSMGSQSIKETFSDWKTGVGGGLALSIESGFLYYIFTRSSIQIESLNALDHILGTVGEKIQASEDLTNEQKNSLKQLFDKQVQLDKQDFPFTERPWYKSYSLPYIIGLLTLAALLIYHELNPKSQNQSQNLNEYMWDVGVNVFKYYLCQASFLSVNPQLALYQSMQMLQQVERYINDKNLEEFFSSALDQSSQSANLHEKSLAAIVEYGATDHFRELIDETLRQPSTITYFEKKLRNFFTAIQNCVSPFRKCCSWIKNKCC